jgi:NTP-dependent ternary system trypsin peptidase co-occuring protein
MKILLLLAAFWAVGCATAAPEPTRAATPEDGAELAAVIEAIKEVIVEGETREVPGFPALKSVVVKLQTSVSRSAGGEVRYLVVALTGGGSSDTTSTLELDMKPPDIRHQTMLPQGTLKDALANAIHLAKIGVAQAAKGDPPLTMKSISIDLKFAVALKGSASAGVKLLPIGLEGTAKISRERVHTVSLTFGS